jgi:hypothetical protein
LIRVSPSIVKVGKYGARANRRPASLKSAKGSRAAPQSPSAPRASGCSARRPRSAASGSCGGDRETPESAACSPGRRGSSPSRAGSAARAGRRGGSNRARSGRTAPTGRPARPRSTAARAPVAAGPADGRRGRRRPARGDLPAARIRGASNLRSSWQDRLDRCGQQGVVGLDPRGPGAGQAAIRRDQILVEVPARCGVRTEFCGDVTEERMRAGAADRLLLGQREVDVEIDLAELLDLGRAARLLVRRNWRGASWPSTKRLNRLSIPE